VGNYFQLEIATRERTVFSAKAARVILPTLFGSYGISGAMEEMDIPISQGVVKCDYDERSGVLIRVGTGTAYIGEGRVTLLVSNAAMMEEGENE